MRLFCASVKIMLNKQLIWIWKKLRKGADKTARLLKSAFVYILKNGKVWLIIMKLAGKPISQVLLNPMVGSACPQPCVKKLFRPIFIEWISPKLRNNLYIATIQYSPIIPGTFN